MTKLLLKLSGVAFILTLLIATGCEDATPDPEALGPEIEFLEGAGLVSMSQDLDVTETTFTVQVSANIGDNPLRSLTFLVDGVAPGAADIGNYIKAITSNGTSITPNNPISAEPDNTNGGVWEMQIAAFDQVVGQTVTYAFEIADDANNVALASVDITIIDPGTPLAGNLTGVLLNQAGPAGTGGLDLDTGDGTGSSAAESEIRDLGIDCTIDPANAENWRGQIGTINGANMIKVDPTTLGEGFTFADVQTIEAVRAAYDDNAGNVLADGVSQSASCAETPVTDVSDVVAVGDLFGVLSAGGTYYLIQIDEVNAIGGSNGDNYVISIKY
jgi:hypothetical protein